MKNQFKDALLQAKEFMQKHAFLMISIKVIKVLIVVFFMSCSSKQEPAKGVDTVKFDDTSLPGDTAIYKYEEGEEEEEEADPIDNGIVPQDS